MCCSGQHQPLSDYHNPNFITPDCARAGTHLILMSGLGICKMTQLARKFGLIFEPDSRVPTPPKLPPSRDSLQSLLHNRTCSEKETNGRRKDHRDTRAWTLYSVSCGKRCKFL
jgi:hypothetical protein